MDSPNQKQTRFLKLRYLDPSQAQPEVKINEAWDILDEAIEHGGGGGASSDGGGGAGTQGPPGPAGAKGKDGEDGRRGRQGFPGANGVAGATGASGGQPPGAYWINLGGGVVTLPTNAVKKTINATGTIKRVIVDCDGGPGSCRIKVWKANITAHYPPVVADDITGGNDVVLSSVNYLDDSTLAGWTKTLAEGDIILFTLASTTNFTNINISLILT